MLGSFAQKSMEKNTEMRTGHCESAIRDNRKKLMPENEKTEREKEIEPLLKIVRKEIYYGKYGKRNRLSVKK